MPVITESECIARGGQVVTRQGPPTWKGEKLKICIIDFENLPPEVKEKFPWIKEGKRPIIIGKA